MRRTKQERGITLIALIITIVVLLILAVVAINPITNEGIIVHTTNSTGIYNNSVSNEKGILDEYENYLNPCNRNGHTWDKEAKDCTEKEDIEATCTLCGEKGTLYWKHAGKMESNEEGDHYCTICKIHCSHDAYSGKAYYYEEAGAHYAYNICARCGAEDGYEGGFSCDYSNGDGVCGLCGASCWHFENLDNWEDSLYGDPWRYTYTETDDTSTHGYSRTCFYCGITETSSEEHIVSNVELAPNDSNTHQKIIKCVCGAILETESESHSASADHTEYVSLGDEEHQVIIKCICGVVMETKTDSHTQPYSYCDLCPYYHQHIEVTTKYYTYEEATESHTGWDLNSNRHWAYASCDVCGGYLEGWPEDCVFDAETGLCIHCKMN